MLADYKNEVGVEDKRLETEVITPELISYITDKIVREINPKQIIMFGSRARGDAKDDSDIDLFVVQDSGLPSRQVRRRIERLLHGRMFSLDLIVQTPDGVELNIQDNNPFYTRHIFKYGKVLYERTTKTSKNPS
jgi:predicted nucleotidyltransferase